MDQLTVLAELFGEAVTPERLEIYAADLADLEPHQLAVAFRRARRELRFFPKISELRELAGGTESVEHEIDRAWCWVTNYIRVHGADGESFYHFPSPRPREPGSSASAPAQTVRGETARDREIRERVRLERDKYRAEHPEVPYEDIAKRKFVVQEPRETRPPEIPPAIACSLRQLAFDLRDGLKRIEGSQDDPASAGWVRKEFGEAYRRNKQLDLGFALGVVLPAVGDGGGDNDKR